VGAREYGDDLLRRLLHLVLDSVPGAVGAGVGLTGRAVAGVGAATRLDTTQWSLGVGPLPEAAAGGSMVVLPALPPTVVGSSVVDLPPDVVPSPDVVGSARAVDVTSADDDKPLDWSAWPGLAERLQAADAPTNGSSATAGGVDASTRRVRGVVVTPGEWGGDAPVVFSVYLDRRPDASALEQIDRLEPLMAEALAVVEYCVGEEVRAQQMLQMVQYRRVIEQAKGMIMAALGQDAGSAFAALARASQHFNVRLRHLAVALVEHVGTAPAEAPDDPEQVVQPTDTDRRVAAQVWAALTADGNRGIPVR
jgi:hypothetical protein